jgi:hypothetical protein
VGIPILDSFTSLFATWVECIKGRYSVKIAEYNKQIRILNKEDDETSADKQLIGFVMEEEDTEDEED